MATKDRAGDLRKSVKQADRIFYRFTGVHLNTIVRRGAVMAGEALSRTLFEPSAAGGKDETAELYAVLHLLPDAPDFEVKAAFRALVRELHPDTGIHPSADKFQKVVESYHDIMLARAEATEEATPPAAE